MNDLDCATDGEPGEVGTEKAVEAAKDKERLKSKLSKTSLAVEAGKKGNSGLMFFFLNFKSIFFWTRKNNQTSSVVARRKS